MTKLNPVKYYFYWVLSKKFDFKIIWRWRESNPRPKRHSGNIYMLRLLFFRLNQGKNQNLTI